MSMTIGEKILRLLQDRSPEWLGRQVGYAGTSVRRVIEGGQLPNFLVGCKIAGVLGVSADWLADENQAWPPPATEEQRVSEIVRDALAGKGLAGELTDEERRLLSVFRDLPEGEQHYALGFLAGLAKTGSREAAEAAGRVYSAGRAPGTPAQAQPGRPSRRAGGAEPA